MRPISLRVAARLATVTCLAASSLWSTSGSPATTPPDAAARAVIAAAKEQLGDSYLYGGNGPDRWDCSGLTSVMWRTAGKVNGIPRTSRDQQKWAWPIDARDALPGDLVFFGNPVTHVSIYLGNGRILDASSSRGAVVERTVWTSDVVRFGRVPRPGVRRPAAPKPAASPAPKPKPAPSASAPAPKPSAKPAAKPSTKPTAKPAGTATAAPAPKPKPVVLRPVPPRGHLARSMPPKAVTLFTRFAVSQNNHAWAAKATGPSFDAAGLMRWSWWRAGLGVLPHDTAAIERLAKPLAIKDLRPGDLVFYGTPAVHVGVYLGDGLMVDSSKVLKRVVVRQVFASESVRFGRLPAPLPRR